MRNPKLTTTAIKRIIARTVGPKRSSKPAVPLILIDRARQWYVNRAYSMVSNATPVNRKAEIKAGRSPKLSMPMESAPRMTVKFIHERNVRSLAKKTFGSTLVGRAIRLSTKQERLAPGLGGWLLSRATFVYLQLSGEEAGWTFWRRLWTRIGSRDRTETRATRIR